MTFFVPSQRKGWRKKMMRIELFLFSNQRKLSFGHRVVWLYFGLLNQCIFNNIIILVFGFRYSHDPINALISHTIIIFLFCRLYFDFTMIQIIQWLFLNLLFIFVLKSRIIIFVVFDTTIEKVLIVVCSFSNIFHYFTST